MNTDEQSFLNDLDKKLWNAVDQGSEVAQYNLAFLYQNGEGVKQNLLKMVKWYRKSAERGFPAAQNNLGLIYATGKGAIQDYILAHMWLNIAASNDDKDGSNNLDLLAKEMTSSQISEAQDMARDCLKKNYKNCD